MPHERSTSKQLLPKPRGKPSFSTVLDPRIVGEELYAVARGIHRPDPPQLAAFLSRLGYGSWDLRTQQGVAKDLVPTVTGGQKQSLLDAINISRELHGVREVLLMNHEDCGAYGGAKAFPSWEDERAAHTRDLRAARQELLTRFPEMSIRLFMISLGNNASGTALVFDEIPHA